LIQYFHLIYQVKLLYFYDNLTLIFDIFLFIFLGFLLSILSMIMFIILKTIFFYLGFVYLHLLFLPIFNFCFYFQLKFFDYCEIPFYLIVEFKESSSSGMRMMELAIFIKNFFFLIFKCYLPNRYYFSWNLY
jgi:hypothetical protein